MIYFNGNKKFRVRGKMKRAVYLFLVLLFVSCGSNNTTTLSSESPNSDTPQQVSSPRVSIQSVLSHMEKGKYREGELLVKFRGGAVAASSLKTHQALGATSLRRYALVPNLEHVRLPSGLSVRDAVIKYMADPNVEYAEPNYIRHISMVPNDSLYSQQWALPKINAPQAWDISTGSSTVIVAVIDTGIDFTHPDLAQNIWTNPGESCTDGIDHDGNGFINDCRGWDFTTCAKFDQTTFNCTTQKLPGNNVMDNNGHGTHVSGIAGAVGNNGTGVAGVMWNVKLMALKMLNADGDGSIGDEVAAIDYAVTMKKRGVNIGAMNASFSGPDFSQAEFDAISLANSAGILLAAAAGNGDQRGIGTDNDNALTPNYPANYSNPGDPNIISLHLAALPNIISVAATDQSDRLASFSNFGLNSVHVAAPGVSILSTYLPSPYDFLSGTSMSTPFVSGLAGLLYSYYTNFTYSQIRGTILRYVDALPTLNGKIMTGGRINAYKALSSLLTPGNLSASASSATQVALTWTDNATGEDGYKVEKRIGGGSFSQITTLAANSTAFTDSSAADGTTSAYRVRAFNSLPNPPGSASIEGNSSYSNEASVTTPLNPPTGLSTTSVSSTSLTLVWTDNSQSEQGYRIEERAPGGSFVQIAEIGTNSTTFTATGLNPSTTYSFRVRAFNAAAGNSQYSNEASATTQSSGGGDSGGSSSGGGGGCSIGSRQNTPTAVADFAVLLMPLLLIAILRRRRWIEEIGAGLDKILHGKS
jgi:subtilisin family serine protease